MSSWKNQFGNALVPTSTSSVAGPYNITSSPFALQWPNTGGATPLGYNTLLNTSTSGNVVLLPPVISGAIGNCALLTNNSTTDALILRDNAGNNLGTLPTQSITQVVLLATGVEAASNWAIKALNVTVGSIIDPSTINGPGLGVDSSKLYPEYEYNEINLGESPTVSPWTIPSWDANALYVFRFTAGSVVLPSASGADVGKINVFKNLTNGPIYLQVPSGSYGIDINIAIQNSSVIGGGLSSVTILPNETVELTYCGEVILLTPSVQFLYSVTGKVSSSSALLQQSSIYLPTTPPINQPVVVDISTTIADVIFVTDANEASPATGGYTYLVPYPIAKVYYFAIETVNTGVSVTINFGTVSASTQVLLTPEIGLVQCYVALDGTVIVSGNTGGSGYALASQAQVDAGVSTNTIVAPSTLQGKYPDIDDNKSTHTVEIIGDGGLSVTKTSTLPTLAFRSIINSPTSNNTNPSAQALISDLTDSNLPRSDYNKCVSKLTGNYTVALVDGFSLLYSAGGPLSFILPPYTAFPKGFTVCLANQDGTITSGSNVITMTDSVSNTYYKCEVGVNDWIVDDQQIQLYSQWATISELAEFIPPGSLAENGWVSIPNIGDGGVGFKINWGLSAEVSNNAATGVLFSSSFSFIFAIVATSFYAIGGSVGVANISSVTTNGFVLYNGGTVPAPFFWIAIGAG